MEAAARTTAVTERRRRIESSMTNTAKKNLKTEHPKGREPTQI
jgi:hypothetical protein